MRKQSNKKQAEITRLLENLNTIWLVYTVQMGQQILEENWEKFYHFYKKPWLSNEDIGDWVYIHIHGIMGNVV